MKNITRLFVVVISIFLFSCGGSNSNKNIKNPLDGIIKSLDKKDSYVVILEDMDYDEVKDSHVHKYKILETRKVEQRADNDSSIIDTIFSSRTDWLPVSDKLFKEHEKNMGMEVLSKQNGKLSKIASPPGYSQYVGNEKYGNWQQNNQGHSTWHFFGQYMFMSTMFHMAMFPVRRSLYRNYGSYRSNGRSYYGNNGTYGSKGRYNKNAGATSSWSKRSSSFRNNTKMKTSRRSSRFSKTSSKSRSGGFGK